LTTAAPTCIIGRMNTDKATEFERITFFYDGMREGIAKYAHWKDGTQYVGTTGRTLKKAIEDIAVEETNSLKAWKAKYE